MMTKREVTLKTRDLHRIEAVEYNQGKNKVVILAHGFFNAKDVYLFRQMAEAVAKHYDVISFDFRGHGKSSGLFTWTSKECADLKAVVDHVKGRGYVSIGFLGFSLGAAIGLLEAAKNPDIKSVIAVASPYDFWKIDYHFWKPGMLEDLRLNLGQKGKGKGVRPSHLWDAKTAPIDVVDKISPRPILFIHGSEDWLIHERHSRLLFNKAKEPKKIVILEKLGHAEMMFDQKPEVFLKLCVDWFKDTL